MTLHRKDSCGRRGLSLLEVLVALVIFLAAFVTLGQLVMLGSNEALDTQLKDRAVDLCQTKMAEVVAGAIPLNALSEVPFEEDPVWQWSLDCEKSNFPGLWNVTVRVKRLESRGARVVCTVSEMILDPQIHGSLQDAPPGSTVSDSSSTGTSPSSSGPTGGGGKAMGGS